MVAIKYTIDDTQLQADLRTVAGRMQNPAPALKNIGLLMIRSIAQNFKAGGRPIAWKPSKRAAAEGGKTLLDTARLARSITYRIEGRILYVGTNVVYGAIHQLGGRIRKNVTVRQHWRIMQQAFGRPVNARRIQVGSHSRLMNTRIPARPYLVVQDSDRRRMDQIVAGYITGGEAAA